MRFAFWLFTCAAHSRFAIAYDAARALDPAGIDERPQAENHGRGIAARIGHEARARERACVKFRQTVNSFRKHRGAWRREFVPVRERFGIAETERAAQVDNAQAGIRCKQIRYKLERGFMRRRQK